MLESGVEAARRDTRFWRPLEADNPELESRVFIAMRYWTPDSRETAAAVKAFAPDEIVLLPLYPQFSSTTTASVTRRHRHTRRAGQVPSSLGQQLSIGDTDLDAFG